jgi:hypothetical protein
LHIVDATIKVEEGGDVPGDGDDVVDKDDEDYV